MKKLYFIIIFFIILFTFSNSKYNVKGLDKEIYNRLSGVWNISLDYKTINKKFSWGYSQYTPNSSVVIDFDNKLIEPGTGFGRLDISSIEKIKKNIYELEVIVPEGFKTKIEIEYIRDNTIKIKDKNEIIENKTYYKIGGPNIKFNDFYYPNVKLKLRNKPGLDNETIRILNKGEKLVVVYKEDKMVTINGINGYWVFIESVEKNDSGWCFDAYLKEVKKK